ncbi:16S rRNA (guanine(527)-N(7))-methyltransferase RsmG [Aquamicrobium segne]|uniref:Ribosomal RNA small subunit methyltransferase G n=1 Tax=Aquamicrobium segne TaxID=469547 RepID=A0ABW0GUP3_9HYPH
MKDQRFEALRLAAKSVSRETYEALREFETHFLKWNQSINLAALSTLSDTWNRHIVDSAQLYGIAPEATRWLDLGSGGGFPGLVLAFLIRERTGHIDLVESNRKKAGFLQAMTGEFNLPARVVAQRIENAPKLVEQPQIVTARALAPLPSLIGLASPWLLKGAVGLFHKGRDYRSEVEESSQRWVFDLIEHKSLTGSDSVVLQISGLSAR